MIRRLRRLHVAASFAGLLLLPSLLALGVSARREVPRNSDGGWQRPHGPDADLDEAGPLRWSVTRHGGPSVVVQVSRDLQEPDLLVYWFADGPLTELPDDAVLLGVLAGTEPCAFPLPKVARGVSGSTIAVYSLARSELIASLPLPEASR